MTTQNGTFISHWTGNYQVHINPAHGVTQAERHATRQALFGLLHDFRNNVGDVARAVVELHRALFGQGLATALAEDPNARHRVHQIAQDLERAAQRGQLTLTREARKLARPARPEEVFAPLTSARETAPEPQASHYIELELLGEDDEPIAGEPYRLKLPNGKEVTGRLDAHGRSRIDNIADPGMCEVNFPNLDAEAWELSA